MLDLHQSKEIVSIKRHSITDKIVANPVSESKVAELREESIVLTSKVDVADWKSAGNVILEWFDLNYCPNIITLSKKRALVELRTSMIRPSFLFPLSSVSLESLFHY